MLKVDLKDRIKFKGLYTLELKNTKTGQKKEYHTHNVILDNMYYAWYKGENFRYIACGTGTAEPSSTDSGLTKQCFTSQSFSAYDNGGNERDYETVTLSFTSFFPATTSYVADITELGIGTSNRIVTHALVKDSEGNAISISKTDTDELTIKADIIVSFNDQDSPIRVIRFCNNFCYAPARLDMKYCNLYASPIPYSEGWVTGDQISHNDDSSYSNKKITIPTKRYGTDKTFYGGAYINSICALNQFQIPFPNADIFPQRTLTGLSVGTGDGVKTEFAPPLPYWVKDTEKVYKNGVLLTRGTDYTCDNKGNAKRDKYASQGVFYDKIIDAHFTRYNSLIPGTRLARAGGGIKYSSSSSNPIFSYRSAGAFVSCDHPLIIKYKTDPVLGNVINTIHPGEWQTPNFDDSFWAPKGVGRYDYGKYSGSWFSLVFSVSEDGDTYTDLVTVPAVCTTYEHDNYFGTGSYSYSFCSDSNEYGDYKLDKEYVMNYMKISMKINDGFEALADDDLTFAPNGSAWDASRYSALNNKTEGDLSPWWGHIGKGIVFTEAPASGDIITMDADIDRPWKDSNYILDFAGEITL